MTLLRWKREPQESAPQTPVFEELAIPCLSALYNIAFWLSRNAADACNVRSEASDSFAPSLIPRSDSVRPARVQLVAHEFVTQDCGRFRSLLEIESRYRRNPAVQFHRPVMGTS